MSEPTGTIVFTRGTGPATGRDYAVFSVAASGGSPSALAQEAGDRTTPVWTDQGSEIVYGGWVTDNSNGDLFRKAAAGGPETVLIGDPADEADPDWCEANKLIVFWRQTPAGAALFTLDEAGAVSPLYAEQGKDLFGPAWSPDGTKVAFTAWTTPRQIFVLDVDAGTATHLLPTPTRDANHWEPAWSPDGTQVAFGMHSSATEWDLYRVNADGSGLQQITSRAGSEFAPSWSPDGKWLAFAHQADATQGNDLWLHRLSDGDQRQLTADATLDDLAPDWK